MHASALNIGDSSLEPPEGSLRSYFVTVASFITNGLIFGVINSYSVIYEVLEKQLKNDGSTSSESAAALAGALAISMMFILSPVSGMMTAILGLQQTAILGGSIAAIALFITSFLVHSIFGICITYGFLYGLGTSLAYTPSLAILGHYFKKYLGIANGFATIGSSIFTIVMPPIMELVVISYGLPWLFRFLAFVTVGIALCGFVFKPTIIVDNKAARQGKSLIAYIKQSLINYDVWQSKNYRLWALTMPVALFGYFVPYVHIKKFIDCNFVNANDLIPLQCIAVASAVGGLGFGYIADKPGMDSVLLQQICFYAIGALTIILPFVTSYALLVVISLAMGFFDGGFIALICPIAFDFCGSSDAGDGIAYVLGLAAIPLSVGPPVAGYLFSIYHSYKLPFILGGCSPIFGATLMFSIRYYGDQYIN